jgi:holo-[acyl-carrier protein] synthase
MEILEIGSDIIECLRIARMIERHGDLFINRVFTPDEVQYCQNRKQVTQHFAARWAAKQAVLQALGARWRRGISWLDIEIVSDGRGKSAAAVRGNLRDIMLQQGVRKIMITIAHCRTHASAFAMALGGKAKKDGKDEL